MKKTLTLKYTFQQMAYWATAAGIVSFATAFLLEKGFEASQVGVLLASGNLLSCVCQPLLAERADRIGGNVIKWLIVILTGLCIFCFGGVQLLPLQRWMFGALYLLGVFTFDVMMPLLNAISVMYNDNGYKINYGVGRGIGSMAYAVSALVIGKIMAAYGVDWMIWIALSLLVINVLVTLAYPSVTLQKKTEKEANDCCSIPVFFQRYKWYCVSLAGIILLGMFHAMTENYLIEVVRPLGGDSGSVGIALFIATAIEMAVIVNFDTLRKYLSDSARLKISGISFLVKSILFLLAGNVSTIYMIQLLQATSYSLLSPTQLYYAKKKVHAADMVKGQAFITASYTLGCAIGNFTGGQILQVADIRALLMAGVAMAAAGTLILFMTVDKKDSIEI